MFSTEERNELGYPGFRRTQVKAELQDNPVATAQELSSKQLKNLGIQVCIEGFLQTDRQDYRRNVQ
uniref:Uncharacterized protein n=1 Tax=Setaria digitata TaxID=48799 RepID=A0A915PJF8_9BILA